MPFDSLGNFTRNYNWTADKQAGIKIESERMDGEFDNYAAAMNQVMLRNGAVPWEGDLALGGNSITGLGDGTAPVPSLSFLSDTTTGLYLEDPGKLGFSANGNLRLLVTEKGATVFDQLSFGGDTVASPALKATGTTIKARLADDSDYAAMEAKTPPPGDADNSVATTAFANSLQGFRNRIINGDMRFDQRHAGGEVLSAAGSTFPADRWLVFAAQAGKLSGRRAPMVGRGGVLLLVSKSAYAPLPGDTFVLDQNIEGANVDDLMWSTPSAKPITVSFLAYSTVGGKYAGVISNGAQNRSYVFTFDLAADAWTVITKTIPGDTAGEWLTDIAVGMRLRFNLGAGANAVAPAANVWSAGLYISAPGCVNLVANNGANFYLTDVQLEAGSQASVFERRAPAIELMLCQRYFWKTYALATVPGTPGSPGHMSTANPVAGGTFLATVRFPVVMRTSPVVAVYTYAAGAVGSWDDFSGGTRGVTVSGPASDGGLLLVGTAPTSTMVYGHVTADAEF